MQQLPFFNKPIQAAATYSIANPEPLLQNFRESPARCFSVYLLFIILLG